MNAGEDDARDGDARNRAEVVPNAALNDPAEQQFLARTDEEERGGNQQEEDIGVLHADLRGLIGCRFDAEHRDERCDDDGYYHESDHRAGVASTTMTASRKLGTETPIVNVPVSGGYEMSSRSFDLITGLSLMYAYAIAGKAMPESLPVQGPASVLALSEHLCRVTAKKRW